MEPEAHYQKIAEELVVAFRGEKSQRDFSQLLGYSFNQTGKWESGSTRIKWDEFIRVAEAVGIPIEFQFRHLFSEFVGDFDPLSSLQQIIKMMNTHATTRPRSTINRWTRGDTVPPLADVLRLLDSRPAILLSWLSQMTEVEHLASLRERYNELNKRMDLVLADPLCVYVNAALQLRGYRDLEAHDENFLAEHSTCSVEQLRNVLHKLLEADVISTDGRKYNPCPYDFSFSASRNAKLRSLTRYTTELAASRYLELPAHTQKSQPLISSRGSVRVAAVSMDASNRIQELLVKFHGEVGEIVAQDKGPKDGVQVILVHGFASNINSPATKN